MKELLEQASQTIDKQEGIIRQQKEWIDKAMVLLTDLYAHDKFYFRGAEQFCKGPQC